jgi:hypothetical protein
MDFNALKFFPVNSKDYSAGKVECIAVENYSEYRDWLNKQYDNTTKEQLIHFSKTIHGENKKLFNKIFGKKQFTYRSEFSFDCWGIDLEDVKIIVLTAKTKGTCWEVVRVIDGVSQPININTVINFFEELLKVTV